ncbi:MAG: hypothetical protein HPY45_06260 [Anaerolineae bacterium]|nr:hypothetical protein [Anaerolineae bacterium]
MMEENTSPPALPEQTAPQPESTPESSVVSSPVKTWHLVAGLVILTAIIVGLVLFLLGQGAEKTALFRDIVIIFMALESLIIGVALIILMIQLAILINLLQNEIKPILNSTNETVNTLRGTATFLSNNLVQPVIKLNEYLAAFSKLVDFFRPNRR